MSMADEDLSEDVYSEVLRDARVQISKGCN